MFSIAPYIFRVVDGKGISQDLSNINGSSLKDIVSSYLTSIKDNPKVVKLGVGIQEKSYIFRKVYAGTSNSVAGLFQTGTQGFESEIYHLGNKIVSHQRVKDEADMLPFHFSFYFPDSTNKSDRLKGLLLLSRFNTLGIRSIVIPDLISYFSKAYPGFKLEVERFVPEALMSAVTKNSQVKKIRLIRTTLPKDFADKLSAGDRKKVLNFECVIRPVRRSSFTDIDWALQAVKNKFDPKSVLSLGEFTPDRVKIEIAAGKKKRTVDLANLGKISSNIDIDHVKVGANGHIDAIDWLKESDELADDVFLSWSVTIPQWNSQV